MLFLRIRLLEEPVETHIWLCLEAAVTICDGQEQPFVGDQCVSLLDLPKLIFPTSHSCTNLVRVVLLAPIVVLSEEQTSSAGASLIPDELIEEINHLQDVERCVPLFIAGWINSISSTKFLEVFPRSISVEVDLLEMTAKVELLNWSRETVYDATIHPLTVAAHVCLH